MKRKEKYIGKSINIKERLKCRKGGLKKDATLTIAVIELIAPSEKNVSVIAPRGGPRIFDLVVRKRVKRAITDSKDAMIEIGATFAGENARFV